MPLITDSTLTLKIDTMLTIKDVLIVYLLNLWVHICKCIRDITILSLMKNWPEINIDSAESSRIKKSLQHSKSESK